MMASTRTTKPPRDAHEVTAAPYAAFQNIDPLNFHQAVRDATTADPL
jgi:hypothetical protein